MDINCCYHCGTGGLLTTVFVQREEGIAGSFYVCYICFTSNDEYEHLRKGVKSGK